VRWSFWIWKTNPLMRAGGRIGGILAANASLLAHRFDGEQIVIIYSLSDDMTDA
jgi:hypothetical protein